MVEYVLLVARRTDSLHLFFVVRRASMSQGLNTSLNSMVNEINNINSQIQF